MHRGNGRVERCISTSRDYLIRIGSTEVTECMQKYTHIYNNIIHSGIKCTPQQALDDCTNLELLQSNSRKDKFGAKEEKQMTKVDINEIVRVTQHVNVEKYLKGRFVKKGKALHVFENRSVMVRMLDTRRIFKKSEYDIKKFYGSYRLAGGCGPPE